MTEPAVETVPGLAALAGRYDAFLLDLWGVLHDGIKPYPGVVQCLMRLRAAGKKTCALSNAPRRVDRIARHMDAMGLSPELLDAVYSSGEATYEALVQGRWGAPWGERCYYIGHPDDTHLAAAIDLYFVPSPGEAAFVLCTGVKSLEDNLADYKPALDACLRYDLPLVCANPDLKVMHGDRWKLCAGGLAAYYESQGGNAVYFGKPHRPVYDRCLEILDVPAPRVLAVGDSFRTDIAGAVGVGVDSLLVAGGLNAPALLPGQDDDIDQTALAELVTRWGYQPRYVMSRFGW